MQNITEILETIGLNLKEAGLYMAALNLGDAPMTKLAKQAGIKRSTAYQIFKGLEKRGIMGSFKMRGGMHFAAMSPEILYSLRKKELADLAAALPQLKALETKKGARPKLSYFEGQEGYRLAIEDSLKKPGNLLRHIGSLTDTHKMLGEKYDLDYYIPTRVKQRISIKCLYSQDTKKNITEREHGKEFREMRFMPQQFEFEGSSLIYDNKIIIVSGAEEMMTVVIESESIAEAEKQKFDLLWELIGGSTKTA
ncbi:MAG: helix-turn-helix domain-containing protein [Patescibacteria group bacterium]